MRLATFRLPLLALVSILTACGDDKSLDDIPFEDHLTCGDGTAVAPEVCDDGNSVDGDGCDTNCTTTACGNGVQTAGEACDDGNATDGDGCDANCTETACGNGVTTVGETCDDGNQVNGDGCDNNCTASACGNGALADTEECDDGNATNGDGCDANCTASGCGNGIKAGSEECDDGNGNDGDGCDSNCTPTGCGNGIAAGEEGCDDGNTTEGDGCDSNCTVTGCGNGVLSSGEVCDDGNATNGDGCDNNCTATACGNGVVTAPESCDDGNVTSGDGCDSNCTPTGCGNGLVTQGESCDDGNQANGDGCHSDCTTEVSPTITSPSEVVFYVGIPSSFTITTTGSPRVSTFTVNGVPPYLLFASNGDGTASLSGTATEAGTARVVIIADNATADVAQQELTVIARQPPVFTVAQTRSATVQAGTTLVVNLPVSNSGGSDLTIAPQTTGSASAIVYDAPRGAVSSGFRNTTYTDPETPALAAQYNTDNFTLTRPTDIKRLAAEGFIPSGVAFNQAALDVTFRVYAATGSAPDFNPLTGGSPLFAYTAAPNSAGVSSANSTVALDLVAAGQTLTLQPGTYWLLINTRATYANRWTRFGSAAGDGTFYGMDVNRNGTGAWTSNNTFSGLNMNIRGNVPCGASWLSNSGTQAQTLAPSASSVAPFVIDASGLSAGTYNAAVCLASNDPTRPSHAVLVTLTVTQP